EVGPAPEVETGPERVPDGAGDPSGADAKATRDGHTGIAGGGRRARGDGARGIGLALGPGDGPVELSRPGAGAGVGGHGGLEVRHQRVSPLAQGGRRASRWEV